MHHALSSPIDRLLAEPQRFGFLQAVRLIERWQVRQEGLAPQDVLAQRLRFRNSLSLAFPPSEIAEFKGPASAQAGFERIEITPAFIGLLGAGGTLPAFYTELFAQREQQRDHSARAFLDVFVHRAVALFYQAWRKHRMALRFEAERADRAAPLPASRGAVAQPASRGALAQLLALIGLGQAPLQRRLRSVEGGVADDALAHYAGLLRQRPVSAAAIRQVLADYFGVPVRLDTFVGRWFTLPAGQQSVLGFGGVLGAGAVLGERVWQRDLRLRLTLGPLDRARFVRFLPGGPGHLALKELLTLLCGVSLEHEVRLTLRAADVRPAVLDAHAAPRLGWDGFLISRPVPQDRCDADYDLLALA